MQFCSTRQFISSSQTLVPLQLAAVVVPADAQEPLTSIFTKVIEACISLHLPPLSGGTRTDCITTLQWHTWEVQLNVSSITRFVWDS